MDMSDSQFEFEDKYNDEDFYDDDVSVDDNNQDDSGMEEKVVSRDSYDTDTDNETDNKTVSSQTPPRKPKKVSNANNKNPGKDINKSRTPTRKSDPYKQSYSTSTSRRAHSDPRGRKAKKSGNMLPYATSANNNNNNNSGSAHNAVIKRVLSASRKKTSALHNVIYELQQQVEALTIANKDLKRSTRVQERDLRKLDNTEAQIPVLLKKHSNEIMVLQEKYKRQKEVNHGITENLKKADNELLKSKDKVKEYQAMVEQKNLGERIELQNNITHLEKVIEEKDHKILELTRTLHLQKKGHNRIIKEKNDKCEKVKEQVKQLEDSQQVLLQRLKDREKALEVTNIYSRRVTKDGKQVVRYSPKDPVAPILKKCQGESFEIFETLENMSKSPETIGEILNGSFVGEKIDTMVSNTNSTNDNEHRGSLSIYSPPGELTTFVTEGKLNREEMEDFFDVNKRKITTKGKKSDSNITADSLGEEELHEKLDQMIEKGKDKEETEDIIHEDKNSIHTNIKGTTIEDTGKQKENTTSRLNSDSSVKKPAVVSPSVPELDDQARKKQLLLARIQAIDNGENPNEITTDYVDSSKANEKKLKPTKKPIFLENTKSSDSIPSDDDIASIKSLDGYSSTNSVSNSANSKSRRNRHFPDPYSESETDSAGKARQRKDSWEFKSTDENLHKGLPAYTEMSPSRTLPSHKRNNDRSLTGFVENQNNNNINGNKQRTNVNKANIDDSLNGSYDFNYSPTTLDRNSGQSKKTIKKNGFDLFNQFEDPFKSDTKNKSDYLNLTKKPDKDSNIYSNNGTLTTATPVAEDLEEMFIL